MQLNAEPARQLRALCESIEAHAQRLSQWLVYPATLNDLRREIETLNGLLTAFTCANELMQQSLNCSDLRLRRQRTREAFDLLRARGMIDSSDPLYQLRELSNQIIGRVLALREKAYRVIEQEVRAHLGAAVEVCSFCNGLSIVKGENCAFCLGRGSLYIGQPSKKLARAAIA